MQRRQARHLKKISDRLAGHEILHLRLRLGTPEAGTSLLLHLWGLRPARLPEGLRISLQDPQTCAAVVRGLWLALPALCGESGCPSAGTCTAPSTIRPTGFT